MWTVLALRAYLLGGLLGHKLVWEVMKRREPHWQEIQPATSGVRFHFIRFTKALFLAAIVAQTLIPDPWAAVLPIAEDAGPLRMAGAILFGVGLMTAILGRVQLGHNWADIERAGVHSSQHLVAHGVYRYIRHPIYAGDLVLLIGLELALNSWLVLAVLGLAYSVTRQAIREEALLRSTLTGYDEYIRQTKRFIPFVY
ncbi:MAG: methyltransferase family protein [Candidatus Eiseniibacteriota bacterium]